MQLLMYISLAVLICLIYLYSYNNIIYLSIGNEITLIFLLITVRLINSGII